MHLYPHASLPFLPKILVPFVGTRKLEINGRKQALSRFAAITPKDVEPAVSEYVANQIAHLVQKLIVSRRHEAKLRETRLELPGSLRVTDLVLTDRAKVSLNSRTFFGADGGWRTASLYDLTQEHSLGARLLLALLCGIEAAPVPAGDAGASATEPAPATDLHAELAALAAENVFSPRSIDVFMRISGWNGRGCESLIDVGKHYQVSNERVRQIYGLAHTAIARRLVNPPPLPKLQEALSALVTITPCVPAEGAAHLHSAGIAKEPFDPNGVLHAAALAGLTHDLEWVGRGEFRYLVRRGQWEEMKLGQRAAQRLLRRHGVVTVEMLAVELSRDIPAHRTRRVAKVALQITPGTTALADNDDWFWQPESAHTRGVPARLIKLVEYSIGWMAIEALAEALGKPGSNGTTNMPRQPLIRLCRELRFFVNEQGEIRCGLRRRSERPSEARTDVTMANLLREQGGTLPKDKFQRLCLDRGINRYTFAANLRTSPLIAIDQDDNCSVVGNFTETKPSKRAPRERASTSA